MILENLYSRLKIIIKVLKLKYFYFILNWITFTIYPLVFSGVSSFIFFLERCFWILFMIVFFLSNFKQNKPILKGRSLWHDCFNFYWVLKLSVWWWKILRLAISSFFTERWFRKIRVVLLRLVFHTGIDIFDSFWSS